MISLLTYCKVTRLLFLIYQRQIIIIIITIIIITIIIIIIIIIIFIVVIIKHVPSDSFNWRWPLQVLWFGTILWNELEYVGYFLKNGEAALKGYRLSDTLVILEGRNMFIVDMTFHDAYVRI